MKILCEEQRTQEWFDVKRGRISASAAHIALMSKATKTRRLYVQKLADDLEGLPDFDDVDEKPWYAAGVYYESWARGWYSFKHDVDVRQIGFAVHDEYEWLGCSPDGLVEQDYRDEGPGGCEIKYRSYLHTFKQHAAAEATKQVMAQVQTSMFVTGRDWWDYINYWRSDDHDKEKGHVQRIYRDDAYIDNALLPGFLSLWDDVEAEMRRRRLQQQRASG